jgi:hypothetical protein
MKKKAFIHIYNKMKKCNTCLEIKSFSNFPKNKRQKDGYHYICKTCRKQYNILNRDKIKEYRENNKSTHQPQIKEWRKNNPERIKELQKKNNSKKTKEQIRLNNQKQKEYKRKWSKNRYKNNINYKISQLLRIRLMDALKEKNNKIKSSIEILGCSIDEFKQHLESLFFPEMTWQNHGEIWEIDHILPCASFDLIMIEEQEKCFHYTNLQPLFKTTEIAKSFGYTDQIGNRNKKDNLL